ncbi:helix-turn-helix domain-containing protein [Amorphus sp. MBR-141]
MNAHAYAPMITETARRLADERKVRLRRLEGADRLTSEEKGFLWSHVRIRGSERLEVPDWTRPRISEVNRLPTIEVIIQIVSVESGVSFSDIVSHRHAREIVLPRHVAMYIAKATTPHSYPVIAKKFDGRDHTTVLYAVQKIERLLKAGDEAASALVRTCAAELRARGYRLPEGM